MIKDYFSTIIVKQSDLAIMAEAQLKIKRLLQNKASEQAIRETLGGISFSAAVLGIFAVPTVSALVSLVAAIGSMTSQSEREIAIGGLGRGQDGLTDMSSKLRDITKYDLYEIEFIFADYTVNGKTLTYVQSDGKVKRAHVKNGNGWVIFD